MPSAGLGAAALTFSETNSTSGFSKAALVPNTAIPHQAPLPELQNQSEQAQLEDSLVTEKYIKWIPSRYYPSKPPVDSRGVRNMSTSSRVGNVSPSGMFDSNKNPF